MGYTPYQERKENRMTVVYITKWALTRGIIQMETEDTSTDMIVVKSVSGWGTQCFHKSEWHIAKKDAAKRANDMVAKKIASLKKSLSKIRNMIFD